MAGVMQYPEDVLHLIEVTLDGSLVRGLERVVKPTVLGERDGAALPVNNLYPPRARPETRFGRGNHVTRHVVSQLDQGKAIEPLSEWIRPGNMPIAVVAAFLFSGCDGPHPPAVEKYVECARLGEDESHPFTVYEQHTIVYPGPGGVGVAQRSSLFRPWWRGARLTRDTKP